MSKSALQNKLKELQDSGKQSYTITTTSGTVVQIKRTTPSNSQNASRQLETLKKVPTIDLPVEPEFMTDERSKENV